MTKPFHLAWFLQGSSAQAWGEAWTGHIGTTWMEPELFLNMARTLERACFDYILLEDSSYVGESFNGSTEIYLKNAIAVPRQDPSVVAALMTQVTSRIGIVPTFGTYAYHPYLLARLVATLDQVSGGRIGWNAVTGSSDFAAMNFGMQGMPEHDLRYDMADEYMEVCRGLWGSWEPGAIIADRKSGVLVDHTKVHAVNYQGRYYSTRGPLNSGPAPQGQPVIAQAGGSPRGRKFAAAHADTIVVHVKGIEAMKAYREDVHKHMVAQGRKPSDCKVLFLINPILGETMEEAIERRKQEAGLCQGAYRGADGAFRQGDQHRLRQVRCRQAAARSRHDQRPSAEPRAVPQDRQWPLDPRDHGELQQRRPLHRALRHAAYESLQRPLPGPLSHQLVW